MAAEGGVEEPAAEREHSSPSSSPMRPAELAVVQRDDRPLLVLGARALAALVARSGSRQERDISWRLGRREGRGDRGGDVWMRARDRPSPRALVRALGRALGRCRVHVHVRVYDGSRRSLAWERRGLVLPRGGSIGSAMRCGWGAPLWCLRSTLDRRNPPVMSCFFSVMSCN